MMRYLPGQPCLLRHKNGEERAILCLFGDQNAEGADSWMEAATAEHPQQANLAECQMVSFWFRFPELRQYGEVRGTLDLVFDRVEKEGWTASKPIEGLHDTGSSVGELADTNDPQYLGPDFPDNPNACGYNAARNFLAVFERLGQPPVFTSSEVDHLRQLMEELGKEIFGHPISLE